MDEVFDDGEQLREPAAGSAPTGIPATEFGNSANQEAEARFQRRQAPASSLPASLRLKYYEPARDFQAGEARASASEQGGTEVQQDLAAALDARSAKTLAQAIIARTWASRDKLTLRLPPSRLELEPGAAVALPFTPSSWTIDQLTVDGFVVVAELSPSTVCSAQVAADAGRVAANSDVVAGPLSLALIDVTDVLGLSAQTPIVLLAASNPTPGWRSQSVEVSFGGQTVVTASSPIKSILGSALTVLPTRSTDLIDEKSSVDVTLVDPDQWLTSCDDDALAAGENLAMVGGEVLQFGQATSLGNGSFRLSRLLRGRGGTEWAAGTHVAGEIFCLLKAGTLQPIALPVWSIGATINASAAGAGTALSFTGECVRPLSPVDLAAELQPSGDLQLDWIRRSRAGFAWIDQIDAPLGENSESYDVAITGTAGTVELTSGQPSLTIDPDVAASLGAGPATIEVRQIGDFGSSEPARITVILS